MALTSRGPWRIRATLGYSAGLMIGASSTAVAIWVASGLASPIPSGVAVTAIFTCVVAALLRDTGLIRLPLPERKRLVPEHVLRRGWLRASLQFGFEMGTGLRTYIPASSPYVVAIALVVLGPGLVATLATAIGFGIGRATVPWLRLAARNQDRWDTSIDLLARAGAHASGVAVGVIFLTLAM